MSTRRFLTSDITDILYFRYSSGSVMEVPTVKRIIIVESIAREALRDTLIKIQNPLSWGDG